MRKVLFISVLITSYVISSPAQANFSEKDYYQWFLKQSQTEQLYQDNARLYIFGNNAKVRVSPFAGAEIVAHLDIGHKVKNIAYKEGGVPKDEINGYGDIWYHVKGVDRGGNSFQGFVWGANIAKAWTLTDVDGDQQKEFVLLGVSSKARRAPSDIKAEICMLKEGVVAFRQTIAGLCLFQDCASSSLLRFVDRGGIRILEATTISLGCDGGIDKMLLVWDGMEFDPVFHSERISKTEFINKEFVIPGPTGQQATTQVCQFSHEDKNFNPVWICKDVEVNPATTAGKSTVKPKA